MKSYTTLKQSKELAKILPLDTADMCYKCLGEDPYDVCLRPYSEWKEVYKGLLVDKEVDVIPCWSLAALLDVISNIFKYNLYYNGISFILTIGDFEVSNKITVDACYEMILKLHEYNYEYFKTSFL